MENNLIYKAASYLTTFDNSFENYSEKDYPNDDDSFQIFNSETDEELWRGDYHDAEEYEEEEDEEI